MFGILLGIKEKPWCGIFGVFIACMALSCKANEVPTDEPTGEAEPIPIDITIPPQISGSLTMSDIQDQRMREDSNTIEVAFSAPGASLDCSSDYLTFDSSNIAIVAKSSVIWGGTYPNCTAQITSMLYVSGTSTIKITVNNGIYSVSDSFVLTVTAVNDAPKISVITDKSTTVGTATAPIEFVISDIESTMKCSSEYLSMNSSDTAKVAHSAVVFKGTIPNCTAVITPLETATGTVTITFTVTDSNSSSSSSFVLTLAPVTYAPTITAIADKTTTTGIATAPIAFVISDADSTLTCSGSYINMNSSDTTKVEHSGVVFGGIYPNCTAVITSLANALGTVTITLTVSDGNASSSSKFSLAFTPANSPPTISAIASKTTYVGVATAPIGFTISDEETTGM